MLNGAWFQRRPRPSTEDTQAPAAEPEPVAPKIWQPRATVEPAPGCLPEAESRCSDGDAWWVDSCGVMYAKAEECGAGLCRAGACEPEATPDCGGEPILGRCDGQIARGCEGGHPFAVDCGAMDRQCQLTEGGPVCRAPAANPCDPRLAPPRCEGDTLVTCVDGDRVTTDCRAFDALCGRPAGRTAPTCIQSAPPVGLDGCEDACGCPPDPGGEEVCDGRDNDGDGWIDESGECGVVDVLAIVIVDGQGGGSYTPEDIATEIDMLNGYFTRTDDYGLEFRLADVIRLDAPEWLDFDKDDLNAMLLSRSHRPVREEFFVPVVFTDRVLVDGVPRPGLSTIPNGTCGGQRRLRNNGWPPVGLIALGKRHWKTTLTHEMGHFFGLCHTHGDNPAPIVVVDAASGDPSDALACTEPCTQQGDGVCDTPPDPGPGECAVGPECSVSCETGAQPDPTNIMAYYPGCRVGFSEQQALLMREALALRRGWHQCYSGEACRCEIVEGDCPRGLSCHPYFNPRTDEHFNRCKLDGPARPGGVCTGNRDCSLGSQCIGQPEGDSRCVRPCDDDTPACRCVEVGGVDYPICIDDLKLPER